MATNVPAALKVADIQRFVVRAAQLEKAKPIVAYWAYYWAVNQILSKGLHAADPECKAYTAAVMDKLEQLKSANANEDAVTDDVAAEAYVEQFGLEVFERADRTVRAGKASKQTAETFVAAAVFLELLNIWGSPEAEIVNKIKFAKFHALRITKAIKAGEDPNLSNPVQETAPAPALDPSDPEVLALQGDKARQPSIQEVPDEHHDLQTRLAAQSSLDQSLHPSRSASTQPQTPNQPSPPPPPARPDPIVSPVSPLNTAFTARGDPQPEVSPVEPSPVEYFPQQAPSPPAIPSPPPQAPQPQYHVPPPQSLPPPQPSQPPFNPQTAPYAPSPHNYYQTPVQPPVVPVAAPPPAHAPPQSYAPVEAFTTDYTRIAEAQKRAKWAISALNFQDVQTAVKELQDAIELLKER